MIFGEAYILFLGTSAIVNVAGAVYLWFNRREYPTVLWWALVMLCSAWVAMAFQQLTTAPNAESAFVFARLRFVGFAFAPVFALLFVLRFTGQIQYARPRWIAALLIVPVLTQIVIWFEPLGIQLFLDWRVVRIGRYLLEESTLGGWYHVHVFYNALIVFAIIIGLGHFALRIDSSMRRTFVSLSACLIFVAYGLVSTLRGGPEPGYRLTPLFLGAGTLVASVVLLRQGLLRAQPVPYDTVFTSIRDAALVISPDGVIVQANPSAERMLGPEHRTIVGRLVTDTLAGYVPSTAPLAHTAVMSLEVGGRTTDCELQDMPVGSTGTRLLLVRDVTAQREAERRQIALSTERERSKILAQFMQDASHEFRTPLSVIQTGLYLLRKQTERDKLEKYADQIEGQTARLSLLVSDLQVMTRIDYQPDVQRMPLDLNTVVRVAAAPYPAVHVTTARTPLNVFADEDLVTTALYKVFDNAVRFSPPNAPVEASVTERDGRAVVMIRDRGPGIPPEISGRVFERFFRADVSRSTAGFGLGLPIVKRVMDLHGGEVRLENSPDKGTAVTLVFDLYDPARHAFNLPGASQTSSTTPPA